jgi:hypothetical protein
LPATKENMPRPSAEQKKPDADVPKGYQFHQTNLLIVWGVCVAISVVLLFLEFTRGHAQRSSLVALPYFNPFAWPYILGTLFKRVPLFMVAVLVLPLITGIITFLVRRRRAKVWMKLSRKSYTSWWK